MLETTLNSVPRQSARARADAYRHIERIDIAASVDTVWDIVAAVRDWPAWLPTVTSIEATDTVRPFAKGARYRVAQPGLGRAEWQVTCIEPAQRFTWEARWLGLRVVGDHLIESTPRGATVELGISFHGVLAGVAWMLFGDRTQGYLVVEADALKTQCELEQRSVVTRAARNAYDGTIQGLQASARPAMRRPVDVDRVARANHR